MVFYKIIFNLLRKITLFNTKLVERKITINYKTISYYKSKNINNSKTIILIHGLNDTKDTFLRYYKIFELAKASPTDFFINISPLFTLSKIKTIH